MKQPVSEHRDSVLWAALQTIVAELAMTGEIAINTAPDYVVAYICRELVAQNAITEAALRPRRGGDES